MFGVIADDCMCVNSAGAMIGSWWRKVAAKFPITQIHEYIVMPNHFHGIVNVGAAPCGRPGESGQPHGVAPTLGNLVNWFKTMTTNQYIHGVRREGWQPFRKKLWQRNYYEHIIRDEDELNHYRRYICDNPANWRIDKENPDSTA